MTDINLAELLARTPVRRPRVDGLPTEIHKQRRAEAKRRDSIARHYANRALAQLHPDDYRELFRQAHAQLLTERGPLPGDPTTNGQHTNHD